MAVGTYISIITLNVNGLNAPTKRHRLAEWIHKQDPYICCLQETQFRPKDTYRLKSERVEKYIPCKWEAKESWSSNPRIKVDIKIKKITSNKEGHYIMIKGSIQEEYITIVNIYAPNIGAPQYIKQTLTDKKGEIDSNIIIVGDFNMPPTPMGTSSKHKINK